MESENMTESQGSIQKLGSSSAPVTTRLRRAPKARVATRRTLALRKKMTRHSINQTSKKSLGEVLRRRRHELNLTQRELADKLGVKPAHVAYLELDRRRPSLSLLSRIAQVLDLKRERLILLSHPETQKFFSASPDVAFPVRKDQAWRDFSRNKVTMIRHKITPKELKILSQVALLGRIATPRSFLFILNSIRQAVEE